MHGLRRALLCAAALALAQAALVQPAMAAGTKHTVRIEGMKFVPERLEVAVGDTITWTNGDIVPHTVTGAVTAAGTGAAGPLESGTIPANGTWTYRVRTKGELAYLCRFHPSMKGSLKVQ